MSATGCLTDDQLLELVSGRLFDEALADADRHLEGCPACRALVAEALKARFSPEANAERAANAAASDPGSPLTPGARVGRYVVEAVIGAGGGGVVYEAQDPDLGRRVALKLLRPGRHRLADEGRAMARLSHPNVVAVYDTGVLGAQVFIAMELVRGQHLAAWLAREARGWREVTGAFVQAGRGLAAAHAVGIVHGDFKPENVLVGADGRLRVGDFGLAHPQDDAQRPRGGLVSGTPLYMSPEQLRGQEADPLSDQFSFCVALYTALFRRHPFGATAEAQPTLFGMTSRAAAGEVLSPPAGSEVPAALVATLRRGLDARPEARHPSLEALLAALEQAARGARRGLPPGIIAAGIVTGAVALVLAGRLALTPAAVCGDGRIESPEECDDGNRSDTDACLTSCRWARCGDGHVRAGVEDCDDGNTADGDACSSLCQPCRAPAGAVVRGNACYTRHDEALDWMSAHASCGTDGGHLVTYDQAEAEDVRARLVLAAAGPSTWIGLSRPKGAGPTAFTWITGVPVEWAPWAQGEPGAHGDCVADEAARWRAESCDRRLPFVCERAAWALSKRDRHAYHLVAQLVPWQAALEACRARGAHLVTIHDDAEQVHIAGLVTGPVWLGATDREAEGRTRWVTGEPFSFTNFMRYGHAQNGDARDCVLLGADRSWTHADCSDRHEYMCEVD